MKKRLAALTALMLAALLLLSLASCTAASAVASLSFTDASGAGSLTVQVSIPSDNGAYLKDAQKLAEKLNSVVDEMTQTEGIYTVEYKGKSGDDDIVTMTYSFSDINDYNKKTMRLFNCVPISRRNSVSNTMSREYMFASWELSDNGDGTYNATFTQNGYIFTVICLWAYDYMLSNDIEDVWDNTGDGQAAQLSLYKFSERSSSFVTATDNVVLTVGDNSQTVKAINGESAATVTLQGKVSGTPATVDLSVTDADLIVEKNEPVESEPAPAPADNIQPMITGIIALLAIIAVAVTAVFAGKKKGEQSK